MGKGDIKTRRGKLFRGSYGVLRRKKKKIRGVPGPEILMETAKPKAGTPKKETAPEIKEEVVQEEVAQVASAAPEKEEAAELIVETAEKKL